eukprot:scaffold6721_cov18-Phaeocystis_antarctica.AAC.1
MDRGQPHGAASDGQRPFPPEHAQPAAGSGRARRAQDQHRPASAQPSRPALAQPHPALFPCPLALLP